MMPAPTRPTRASSIGSCAFDRPEATELREDIDGAITRPAGYGAVTRPSQGSAFGWWASLNRGFTAGTTGLSNLLAAPDKPHTIEHDEERGPGIRRDRTPKRRHAKPRQPCENGRYRKREADVLAEHGERYPFMTTEPRQEQEINMLNREIHP